jgi:hypothetical protein
VNLKAILIVAGLVIGGSAIAQTGGKAGAGQQGGQQGGQRGPGMGGMRRMTPEQRVERMAKELKLTAAQKTKVLAVYKASGEQGRKIFQDQKMTNEQKRKAFEKFRDENNKKIEAILTKEQVKKYKEMRQRRPGGPGGGPAPAGNKSGGAKSGGGTKTGGKSGG